MSFEVHQYFISVTAEPGLEELSPLLVSFCPGLIDGVMRQKSYAGSIPRFIHHGEPIVGVNNIS